MELKYFELLNKRIDHYGDDMREGFTKIFEKLDVIQEGRYKESKEIDSRLTKIESQNSVLWKMVHYGFAALAGVFGGWLKGPHV